MKVVGLDYASKSYSGLALAVNRVPTTASTFHPNAKRDESDPELLLAYEHWLTVKLGLIKPEIVVVEHLAVFQSKPVIRALSHREAVCLLVAKKKARIVIHRTISQARKVVYQDGGISKDEAWTRRAKVFPDFDFGHKTTGGLDKMDAMTLATAGEVLLERA